MTRQGRDSSPMLPAFAGDQLREQRQHSEERAHTVLISQPKAQLRMPLCPGAPKGWAVGQTRCLGTRLAAQN